MADIRKTLKSALLKRFILVSAIPILVVGLLSLTYLTDTLSDSIRRKNELLAEAVSREIRGELRDAYTILNQVAGFFQDHAYSHFETFPPLDGAVHRSGYFESIYLMNAEGQIETIGLAPLAAKNRADYLGLDLSMQPQFGKTLKGGRALWSDAYLSVVTGDLSLTLSIPFGGKVLAANFSIERLKEAANRLHTGTTVSAMVIDRKGVLLFHPDPSLSSQKRNLSNLSIVARGLEGISGTETYTMDGMAYIGSVSRIPETGWLLIVSQELNNAEKPLRRVRNLFILGILTAVLLAAAVAVKLSASLSAPLAQLGVTAGKIAGGDYRASLPPQPHREMDDLAASLRHMSFAIESREKTLDSLARGMAQTTGAECLDLIVKETCRATGSDMALVGWLSPDNRVQVLVAQMDGSPLAPFSYPLSGTPCEKAMAEGLCFFPEGITRLFPKDIFLVQQRIQGYVGLPLHDSTGRPAGILSALSRKKLVLPERAEDVLTIIAARAQSEIERQRAEADLKALNDELEKRVETRTRALSESIESLKNTQKQLVESEKMASLGELVAGVAHEINTPIGIGVTSSSFLLDSTLEIAARYREGNFKRSELERYIEIAQESSEAILMNLRRGAELIQNFKLVAADQTTEARREFNLKAYLYEALASLRPKLKQKRHSVTITGADDIVLNSFPGIFMQILTNLVMNSLIHAFAEKASGRITIDLTHDGESATFRYRDDGAGMTREQCDRIFEPFYTTRRGSGGTGLGMHIVYNLVTRPLGGRIKCDAAEGAGTGFNITFPKVSAPRADR